MQTCTQSSPFSRLPVRAASHQLRFVARHLLPVQPVAGGTRVHIREVNFAQYMESVNYFEECERRDALNTNLLNCMRAVIRLELST